MPTRSLPLVLLLLLPLLFVASAEGQNTKASPLARFTVQAGDSERIDTLVSVEYEGPMPQGPWRLVETAAGRRRPVACQVEKSTPCTLSWILSGTTPAQSRRVYELEPGDPPSVLGVDLLPGDGSLFVMSGKAPALEYHDAPVAPPEGVSPVYTRGGFIHPLWSPKGEVLTMIHPSNHWHHLGLWMPWTHTEFEGRQVDFWNLVAGQGTVRLAGYKSQTAGPVWGGFVAKLDHVDLSAPEGEKTALNEERDVRVARVGGARDFAWVVDFTSTQRCASDSPLTLEKYRYGGFGLRGRPDWTVENSRFLTSEGKTRENANTSRARWCIVDGETKAGRSGIVFMSHPENHMFPEPMRIWTPGMDGIFFNWCPIQEATAKEWVLQPGNDYIFRYRMYVYDGELTAADADRLWNDFGNPPKVSVEEL